MSTNYKDDFTFKTQSKLKSYAPLPTFIKPGVKMDSSTESQERFKGRLFSCRLVKPMKIKWHSGFIHLFGMTYALLLLLYSPGS